MMKNIIQMDIRFITLSIFFSITFIVQSHSGDVLDSLVEHYFSKNIISNVKVDIDGDGKLDYLAIYEEPLANDSSEIVVTNLVTILSSDNYEEFILKDFIPSQKKSKNGGNLDVYTITLVNKIKDGVRIIISKVDEKLTVYRRTVTFKYDKKERALVAIKDGGIGVFGESEKYINVEKFTGEKITLRNWNEWYSSLMCSNPTTLNNKFIFVNTESEFINAIGNNSTIIIKSKKLDLSLGKISEVDIINKEESPIRFGGISKDMGIAYDDSAWWIEGVTDMSIIGSSTQLSSTNSKEYILWLNRCKNIELSNVTIFHNLENNDGGDGWNMCISNSSDVAIKHTIFKNWGGTGLFLYNSNIINVSQSSFDGLNNFALLSRKSKDLLFTSCRFYKNRSTVIQVENSFGNFINCSFYKNNYYYLVFLQEPDLNPSLLTFISCKEYDNTKLYDISAKFGYSYFGGIEDSGVASFDKHEDFNSGKFVFGFY